MLALNLLLPRPWLCLAGERVPWESVERSNGQIGRFVFDGYLVNNKARV